MIVLVFKLVAFGVPMLLFKVDFIIAQTVNVLAMLVGGSYIYNSMPLFDHVIVMCKDIHV